MSNVIDILVPIEQEGTTGVVRNWFVAVGDQVAEGDPLVELETDKVAVEVPAPQSGTLTEIALNSDAEAPPGALLGKLDISAADTPTVSETTAQKDETLTIAAAPTAPSGKEHRHSPAVRRILAEAGVSGEQIAGTGKNGRITKADALAFVKALNAKPAPSAPATVEHAPISGTSTKVPHTPMRRSIAAHMSQSLSTAPHVTAVFEADFSAIIKHRNAHKSALKQQGVNLTFTAYFIAAAVEAMKVAPHINSRWHDDFVEMFGDVNIGVGTALGDDGLIVPVVKKAQSLSLRGIAEQLQDLTTRARDRKLKPQDTQGGTFTISNHGVSGSLVAAPIIINQPQSAILGIGKLEKRVSVIEVDGHDTIQIRPKAFVSLSIDHRVIDGHQTNSWLTRFVEVIENWPAE